MEQEKNRADNLPGKLEVASRYCMPVLEMLSVLLIVPCSAEQN